MLTELKIRRYKGTPGKREILWDRGGLGLLIGSRKKTWIFRYSFDGKRSVITLGEYPLMSLTDAQLKAHEARVNVKRGMNPGAILNEAKRARKSASTFEEIVNEFWDRELSKQKSGADRRRLLLKDVVPVWGKLKAASIKRRDIVVLLDEIEKRSKSTRNHIHGVLGRLFNFAAERGIIDDSPCTRIKKPKEDSRSRVLSDEEIKLVWMGLSVSNKAVDIYVVTKLALKMILLTGQRPGEVAGMTWDEIDGDQWSIPAGRMKGGAAHRVPLCAMAKDVIAQARLYSSVCPYVFSSSYKDGSPVARASLSKAIVRHWKVMGLKEPFTPHDLRRTLRTRLAELGIDDVVAEKVIGHQLQGMLAVYNRHGYDTEMRAALEKWEERLRSILTLNASDESAEVEGLPLPVKGQS